MTFFLVPFSQKPGIILEENFNNRNKRKKDIPKRDILMLKSNYLQVKKTIFVHLENFQYLF